MSDCRSRTINTVKRVTHVGLSWIRLQALLLSLFCSRSSALALLLSLCSLSLSFSLSLSALSICSLSLSLSALSLSLFLSLSLSALCLRSLSLFLGMSLYLSHLSGEGRGANLRSSSGGLEHSTRMIDLGAVNEITADSPRKAQKEQKRVPARIGTTY